MSVFVSMQAAQASLARTAAYARTGEFGDGDEEGDAGGAGPLDADITGQGEGVTAHLCTMQR